MVYNHNTQCAKLEYNGIRCCCIEVCLLFMQFFQNVELNGKFFTAFDCMWCSARICPTYLVNVNDIFNVLDELNYILFFNTRLVFSGCNVIFVFNHMPVLFSLFTSWFIDNHLALHSKKTNFVLLSSSRTNSADSLMFDLYTMHTVTHLKYLGISLDNRLYWNMHLSQVKSCVSKGFGMFKCCYRFLP